MKILALRCRVAAQMGICRAESPSEVGDMSEQMALGVLRTSGAEVGADIPICGSAVGDRVTPHVAAVRVDAAVPVDGVKRRGAYTDHHQRFLARCLEPVEGAVRQ